MWSEQLLAASVNWNLVFVQFALKSLWLVCDCRKPVVHCSRPSPLVSYQPRPPYRLASHVGSFKHFVFVFVFVFVFDIVFALLSLPASLKRNTPSFAEYCFHVSFPFLWHEWGNNCELSMYNCFQIFCYHSVFRWPVKYCLKVFRLNKKLKRQ